MQVQYTRATLFDFVQHVLVCAAEAGLNKDVTANYEEAGQAAAREVKRAELASALAAVSWSFQVLPTPSVDASAAWSL
jgi:hypothetical protein